MFKLCWCTDIHLDHLTEYVVLENGQYDGTRIFSYAKLKEFCDNVNNTKSDALLITGDISEAPMVKSHLEMLEERIPEIPIYFVLGNHDYYHGSIKELRESMKNWSGKTGRLKWLNQSGIVRLTDKTALVGHDGWYDGGYGDWHRSRLVMADYHIISEMRFQPPVILHKIMQELAKQCADHIIEHVGEAAKNYENVMFATHVPAFRNNSRAPDRSLSDSSWLPNMSSKQTGDALLATARSHPKTKFMCFSGHTHTGWEERYLPNLQEFTGWSNYGSPSLSIEVVEVE